MPVEFVCLKKANIKSVSTFNQVDALAHLLLEFLRRPEIEKAIADVHVLGASSASVQAVILTAVEELGFVNEKQGLFSKFDVPALRPDYFAKVADSGILLEVERGKTTTNNMDLLDFWKCHICEHADYLFLLVPQARPSKNGTVMRHFKQVKNRLGTFFQPRNYANVEAVFLFGY